MNTIIVHPETQEESIFLEKLLERMKFSFEKRKTEHISISQEELESVNRGILQAEENKLSDSKQVHQKARVLCSK